MHCIIYMDVLPWNAMNFRLFEKPEENHEISVKSSWNALFILLILIQIFQTQYTSFYFHYTWDFNTIYKNFEYFTLILISLFYKYILYVWNKFTFIIIHNLIRISCIFFYMQLFYIVCKMLFILHSLKYIVVNLWSIQF